MPQNRTDIKAAARECLRGRMLRSFVVCLIPMLPSLLMMFFPRMPDALYFIVLEDAASGMVLALTLSPTLTCLSLLLNALVAGPMTVRQAGYFLQLNRDAEHVPSPLSVCDCFGPGYWRLVAATLPSTLILLLIQYLPMLLAVVIPGMAEPVDASDVQMLRLHMPAIVPLVIALVGFYGALRLLMVPYIMAGKQRGRRARSAQALPDDDARTGAGAGGAAVFLFRLADGGGRDIGHCGDLCPAVLFGRDRRILSGLYRLAARPRAAVQTA